MRVRRTITRSGCIANVERRQLIGGAHSGQPFKGTYPGEATAGAAEDQRRKRTWRGQWLIAGKRVQQISDFCTPSVQSFAVSPSSRWSAWSCAKN
jgi:hypothetical protein